MFVRQEAMEKDDDSTSKGSNSIRCQIKVTSTDDEEFSPTVTRDYKEINAINGDSIDKAWSTTSQPNTESGSEDNFSLMPDRSLSRSSEVTSDDESGSSEIYDNSLLEEFEVKQVELGRCFLIFFVVLLLHNKPKSRFHLT